MIGYEPQHKPKISAGDMQAKADLVEWSFAFTLYVFNLLQDCVMFNVQSLNPN